MEKQSSTSLTRHTTHSESQRSVKSEKPARASQRTPTTTPRRAVVTQQPAIEGRLTPEAIRTMVAEAAYYRSMQRGFVPGLEQQDWLEAEQQVVAHLQLFQRL